MEIRQACSSGHVRITTWQREMAWVVLFFKAGVIAFGSWHALIQIPVLFFFGSVQSRGREKKWWVFCSESMMGSDAMPAFTH
jgi:hypothetical protein